MPSPTAGRTAPFSGSIGFGLTEDDAMKETAGQHGKPAGDEDAADIKPDHRIAMRGNMPAPDIPQSRDDAGNRQRNEEMDRAESSRSDAANEECRRRRDRHQDEIHDPDGAMRPRALGREKYHPRAERESRQHRREVDLDGERRLRHRLQTAHSKTTLQGAPVPQRSASSTTMVSPATV